ncbi:hypothetical protein ENUP19_0082G0004 [Entamoeba nuttalli]|uniref:Rab family GTPase n=1 Tax=Entamoeba nuttalli TaxID=412467 RepID=A0ABQ0DF43_9EUKA
MKQVKVSLIGDSGVGKTSLLSRFINNTFSPTTESTVGANFFMHEFRIDGKMTQVALWDTASQERYRSLVSMYYRNTNGCLIVFALDNRDSFYNIKTWYNSLVNTVGMDVAIIIVGNKNDLPQPSVSRQEIKALANELHCSWCLVSAKTGDGVSNVFETIASMLHISNDDESDEQLQHSLNDSHSQNVCC